jgi:light-harvesting protein B-800-850 alpha chain
MNQARIWLVVKPTVGVPVLLGAVAVTALIVHASILSHTTWFSAYWQGRARPAAVSSVTPNTPALAAADRTVQLALAAQ